MYYAMHTNDNTCIVVETTCPESYHFIINKNITTIFIDLCSLSSVTNYDTKNYVACANNGSYIVGTGGFYNLSNNTQKCNILQAADEYNEDNQNYVKEYINMEHNKWPRKLCSSEFFRIHLEANYNSYKDYVEEEDLTVQCTDSSTVVWSSVNNDHYKFWNDNSYLDDTSLSKLHIHDTFDRTNNIFTYILLISHLICFVFNKKLFSINNMILCQMMLMWFGNNAQSVNTMQKILANDGEAADHFGNSVSINGVYAIIGALWDNNNKGVDSGAAYIFKLDPVKNIWTQMQKLLANDGTQKDMFGISVSMSNEYALVGAHSAGDAVDVGAAYIFKLDSMNHTWFQMQKLVANDGKSSDFFGRTVCVNDQFAIIGAISFAYIFTLDPVNNTWYQMQKLIPNDGAVTDTIGISVSMSFQYAIIGAYFNNISSSGSAYIFKLDPVNNIWKHMQKLVANDEENDAEIQNYYGQSVSISGEYAIFSYRNKISSSSSAYIFILNPVNNSWSQMQKLVANDGKENSYFGRSVCISGVHTIIGADGLNGSAYIFQLNPVNNTWEESAKLVPNDGAENDKFGPSVSIGNGYVIVGSWYDDNEGQDSGSAYILRNYDSCNDVWNNANHNTLLLDTYQTYLVNYSATQCLFTNYPTSHPTYYPSNNPTTVPTVDPTEAPSMSPTFNPTNYNQYDDPNNAHFKAIYELRQLTTENIQKIIANIVDFTQILSMIIETSYVKTSTSNDLNTNDFWVKIERINDETVEQLEINQDYFRETLALDNTMQIKVTVECDEVHCLILNNSYNKIPFENMTQYKLNKYFETSLNELQFVVISMIYNHIELKIPKKTWKEYTIALFVGGILIFVFCIVFYIYKRITKEKQIFISNVLVAIIGIEFYDNSNVNETDINGYCDDLPAVSRDMENLKKLFNSLNYTVMTNNDKLEWNSSEIKQFLETDIVNELINDSKKYDGLLVTVSSHGLRDNIITSNMETVDKTAIHRMVSKWRSDGKHKRIRDIPRIFIFDSCSGANRRQKTIFDEEQMKGGMDEKYNLEDKCKGIEYESNENEWASSDKNPDYNILKIDAANTGFQAFSDNMNGSYLIALFVSKIKQYLETKSLMNIFEEIQDELHDTGKQLIQINPSGKIIKYVSLKSNNNKNIMDTLEHESKAEKPKLKQSYSQCVDTDEDDECYQDKIVEMPVVQPFKSTAL